MLLFMLEELLTCLGRWNRLFLRNMFFAWLHVPSIMITLCFTVPTSWFCTNSSKSWDLGPGYKISVLGSWHSAARSACLTTMKYWEGWNEGEGERENSTVKKYVVVCFGFSVVVFFFLEKVENPAYFASLNLLPTITLHFSCGRQAASSGTVRSTRLSFKHIYK